MKVTARATAAVLAGAGLLSTALTACDSDRAPLACSVQLSSAAPVQGSNELVTVKTVAGAKVIVAAQFRTSEPVRAITANSAGVARIAYAVGNAAAGYPVKVTAGVSENGANGSCTKSFTPQARPTLHAATIGIAYSVPALPHGSGACGPGHASDCGTITATVLVSGFSQFGGTPTCTNSDVNTCENFRGAVLSGQLSLAWTISCPSTQTTDTRNDVPVRLGPTPGSFNYKVTPVTRVNADTARVQISANLPFGSDVSGCSQTPTLLSLNATNAAFRLIGGGYPTAYFSAVGPFNLG